MNRRHSASGFTFAELAAGLAIIATMAVILISHIAMSYKATRSQKERVFAFHAAQRILSEVRAKVDLEEGNAAFDLDSLNDTAGPNPVMTIALKNNVPVAPDHPLSQNWREAGTWTWYRTIKISRLPGGENRTLRYVTVTISRLDGRSSPRPLASLSSVVQSISNGYPASQTFDLFVLAIENIPGWWVHMESIRPFVEATLRDLESRNPGLVFRTHWITKTSYGRDQLYRPYVNVATDSQADVPYVYWYPGMMPSGSASGFYYVPDLIRGRIATDIGERNGYDAQVNPLPYALADQHNHAMRLPEERALHDARVAAVRQRRAEILQAQIDNVTPPPELQDMSEEPTLRLLLEDMASTPDRYRNALVINLHGELVPMPALRNYADAAKDPEGLPLVRAVTHPELLRAVRDPSGVTTQDVALRVHAYTAAPESYTGPAALPESRPIAVQIMGMDLTDGTGGLAAGVSVQRLAGGLMVGGTDEYTPFEDAKRISDPTRVAGEMVYEARFVDPGAGMEKSTLLLLHNTPVSAPQVASTRGLANSTSARLYGLEYVPAPVGAGGTFTADLATTGSGPKNTARWRLVIPKTAFADTLFVRPDGVRHGTNADVVLDVRTRIWDPALADPLAAGTCVPTACQPGNLSRTFCWWTDTLADVPMTERAQFLGDPRHLPYADLQSTGTSFPAAYNWFFSSLVNGVEDARPGYPGLDAARLFDRWRTRCRVDVPRFFELLRTAIVGSSSIYNSLVGYTSYYMGVGGEVGGDANNGYPSGIPVNLRPFGSPAMTGFEDSIRWSSRWVQRGATGGWCSMSWLGELCPDEFYATQWLAKDAAGQVRGNLDAGPGAQQFFQARGADALASAPARTPFGTNLGVAYPTTGGAGCTSMFAIGSTASSFNHASTSGQTGSLVGAGLDLAQNYGIDLKSPTSISRPFSLTAAPSAPTEYNLAPYAGARYSASIFRTYYNHQNGTTGSGLIRWTHPSGSPEGYAVVNGLSETGSSGTSLLSKYSVLSTLHSFFEAGTPGLPSRIQMPARVAIESPTDISEIHSPVSIAIQVSLAWTRWDGRAYSSSIPGGFTEDESRIRYVAMFSRDFGRTWSHIQDGSRATPGTPTTVPALLVADSGPGNETLVWTTPAVSFPAGIYLLRVEGYRDGQALCYSSHQVKIFLTR